MPCTVAEGSFGMLQQALVTDSCHNMQDTHRDLLTALQNPEEWV